MIRLTPSRKYGFDVNIEGSQNLGGLFVGSNLVGLNFNLQNRNFARRAIQATYSVGVATEVNSAVTQTTQLSGAYSLLFPRLVWPWKRTPLLFLGKNPYRTSLRSSLAFNTRYIHRIDYLDLVGVNASWGYDGARANKIASARLNVEYTTVNKMSILNRLIETNKSYGNIFSDGLILSTILNNTWTYPGEKRNQVYRAGIELSGVAAGLLFHSDFLNDRLKRFVKLDFSYTSNRVLGPKTTLAFRVLAGAGFTLNSDSARRYMPFNRAYFGGGANSMRGWSLRRLGPGSAIKSFALSESPERFGDMQLETNLEYRFQVAEVGGVFLNSVVFLDAGNIWFIRKNANDFPGGEFPTSVSKFFKDLAIDVGTGLRLDFGFIKLRVDYAFKAKDPSPADIAAQNKFFYKWNPLKGTVQIGVDYPF